MIYFFEKDGQFRQLEIYPERPYTLACIDATAASPTERFGSATDLEERRDEVQSCVKLAGADRSAGMDAHDCSACDKGQTATMTKEQLQTTVDQHSFVLNGIPYIFTFRWAANEGRWSQ